MSKERIIVMGLRKYSRVVRRHWWAAIGLAVGCLAVLAGAAGAAGETEIAGAKLSEILAAVGLTSAITLGLVEAVKRTELVPSRWAPLAAFAVGIAAFTLYVSAGLFAFNVGETLLAGLISGSIAAGTYSSVKALAGRS